MGQRGMQFKNAKERGEWAEVRFLARATELRFRVAKLWGDSAPYDLMVEQDGRAFRVQVKSTMRRPKGGAYPCHVPAGKRLEHVLEEIDFVAAYIIPLDLWYIIPAGVVAMRKGSIWLAPWRRQSKYERYLEAWHLLRRWRGESYAGKGEGSASTGRETSGLPGPSVALARSRALRR
ncbi:MAG: group I intron-associated PD-(D/E)XK endonuclease [Candidatus Sulfotelmatobacter sp.]|jgi:PD-(D/E)XK nuclease superfamily protein